MRPDQEGWNGPDGAVGRELAREVRGLIGLIVRILERAIEWKERKNEEEE